MASTFDQFELLLRERMPDGITNLMLEDDDVAWNIIGTMAPETEGGASEYDTGSSDYPSELQAKYRIKVQRGGRVGARNFAGNTLEAAGFDSHQYIGQAIDALYLDPRKTPLASYIGIKMALKRIIGSITVNKQQFFAQKMATPLDDLVSDAVMDATAHVRSIIVNSFYTDGTGTVAYALNSETVTETAGGVTVELDQGMAGRFMKGQRVVAGTDADPSVLRTGAGANGASGEMIVTDVNMDSTPGSINLQSVNGVGNVSITAGDRLFLADTYAFGGASHAVNSRVPHGVEAYLISSGVYPGTIQPKFTSGIDVSNYSELRALIGGNEAALVEPSWETMGPVIDNIKNSQRSVPTAWIMERAIKTRWSLNNYSNDAMIQVPMGATFQAAGGVAGPVLSHMEDRFQPLTSIRVRPKSILGLNPSTWRKFIPMGDRAIEWFYSRGVASGISSIFMPVIDNGITTELAEAPFDAFCEFGCFDPKANFRRIGFQIQS